MWNKNCTGYTNLRTTTNARGNLALELGKLTMALLEPGEKASRNSRQKRENRLLVLEIEKKKKMIPLEKIGPKTKQWLLVHAKYVSLCEFGESGES